MGYDRRKSEDSALLSEVAFWDFGCARQRSSAPFSPPLPGRRGPAIEFAIADDDSGGFRFAQPNVECSRVLFRTAFAYPDEETVLIGEIRVSRITAPLRILRYCSQHSSWYASQFGPWKPGVDASAPDFIA